MCSHLIEPNAPADGPAQHTVGVIEQLRGRLVVSCQAPPGHPLADVRSIVTLCECAERGGAAGVRVEGIEAVKAAKLAVAIPVIGLKKVWHPQWALAGGRPAITPSVEDAIGLVAAGADIVAVEVTNELRRLGLTRDLGLVKRAIDVPVLADVSARIEGVAAFAEGADLVGTTLSGYTPESELRPAPDLELVRDLVSRGIPTVAEGRISRPEDASTAIEAGAIFVVVGKAITDPLARTTAFVAAIAERLAEAKP